MQPHCVLCHLGAANRDLPRIVAVIAITIFSLHIASAQGADPPSATRFARQVREFQQHAADIRAQADQFIADCERLDGFAKDDLPGFKAAAEAEALLSEKVAAAFARDDAKQAESLNQQLGKASQDTEIWRHRISEWRRRQHDSTPTEAGYVFDLHWVRGNALPEYFQSVQARRAAARAWGALAEATIPGADQATLNELYDQAWAADICREMAEMTYNWANRREEILYDRRAMLSSDQITQLRNELDRLHAERLKLREADIQRDRRIRELDRLMRKADSRLQKAADAAREARAKAESRK